MIHIGVDPGVSGGIAALTDQGGVVLAVKMPDTDHEIFEVFRSLVQWNVPMPVAWLENVHPMPHAKAGVIGAFKLGQSKGALRMALAAAGIPFQEVAPLKWQNALGCRTRGDKRVSRRKAQDLFPTVRCTHNISDALLIAEYGRRQQPRLEGIA